MPILVYAGGQPLTDLMRWWSGLLPAVQRNVEAGLIIGGSLLLAKMAGAAVRHELAQKGFDRFPLPPPSTAPAAAGRGAAAEASRAKFGPADALGWLAATGVILTGCWLAALQANAREFAAEVLRFSKVALSVGGTGVLGVLLAGKASEQAYEMCVKANLDSDATTTESSTPPGPRRRLSPLVAGGAYWLVLLLVMLTMAELSGMPGMATLLREFALLVPRAIVALLALAIGWHALRLGPRVMTSAMSEATDSRVAGTFRWSGQIVYLLFATAAAGALLGVNTVAPSFWTIVLIALGVAAYLGRDQLGDLLAGLQLLMHEARGKRVKWGDAEFVITVLSPTRCWIKNDDGQKLVRNREVLRALTGEGEQVAA